MGDQDDFAMGKMVSFNEDGSTFQHVTFKEYKLNKTYEHVKLDDVPFFSQVKVGVVLKLIRKSFYDAHHISFVEGFVMEKINWWIHCCIPRHNHFHTRHKLFITIVIVIQVIINQSHIKM